VERDQFIDRAQAAQARTFRAEYIEALGKQHNFRVADPDARKYFDGDRAD
jgi:hypothetical protein